MSKHFYCTATEKEADDIRSAFSGRVEAEEVLKSLSDRELLLLGESHSKCGHIKFLAQRMPLLKERGFRTLALEVLCEEDQELLDAYSRKRDKRLELSILQRVVSHEWCGVNPTLDWRRTDNLIVLMRSALDQGMRVVGFDDRDDRSRVIAALKRREEDEGWLRVCEERDRNLAKALERTVQEKALVLCGLMHSFKDFGFPRRIDGVTNATLAFVGEHYADGDVVQWTTPFEQIAEEMGIHRETWGAMADSESIHAFSADGIIHLAQETVRRLKEGEIVDYHGKAINVRVSRSEGELE